MYVMYVIRSESTGIMYTGQTSNLLKRLAEHNDPACYSSRFTKRIPGPWVLVYQEECATRSEACRRERWFSPEVRTKVIASLKRGTLRCPREGAKVSSQSALFSLQ